MLCFAACQCQRQQQGSQSISLLQKIKAANDGQQISHAELMEVVTVLGEMKAPGAEDQIIKLMLKTDDLAIGNACIMALGEIKSPQAMLSIIKFIDNKPSVMRRQAIIAARKIADDVAAGWLLANAYGHEDPTVRKEALSAFEEVNAKIKKESKEH